MTVRRIGTAWSVTAWWMLLTLFLWFLGTVFDQPASLAAYAASAALMVAIGEAGDWLRRRLVRLRSTRP
ncbi:hypothetical protein ABZO31_11430 [Streptomyces sp. HUAS MG47]|uniref:hypothetical protein n=1 Tax=Streptomyces solicamelliae TaxID=3231716 RepID=UPI00387795A1